MLLIILFFISVLLIIHSYILYPYIIRFIAASKKNSNNDSDYQPYISILCSAYNEEKVIAERVENILNQNYDLNKIEFILGSDCSGDRTNEIILLLEKKYPWLKAKIYTERGGKAAVINKLVKEARYDILVFTDANTEFDKDALRLLVKGFNNPAVGGISGRLILNEPVSNKKESVEEKKYWDYEISIKQAEGRLGILIGANGGIFAVRKELFREIPIAKAVTDDFFISLCILSGNYKFLYCYDAFAIEEIGASVELEMKRKIRFAATNFQTVLFFRDLLFNRNLLVSFAFWSHKIIRWIVPFLFIIVIILNLLLLTSHEVFKYLFILQVCFYLSAFIGYIFSLFKIRITVFSVPYFFVLSNCALFIGYFRFLMGRHSVIWQSTPR